ncbi:MAG: IS3 family transposase [Thermoplasmata archaeon]|nr:IS3 family transposase [Thermoplasmata archaeon]
MGANGLPESLAARPVGLARRPVCNEPRGVRPSRHRSDEPKVRAAVRRVALARPTFGVRKVWAMLRRERIRVNRKRVYPILREEHLLKAAHFPRPRLPLTGRLFASRPNERWTTDLTYIDTIDRGPCPLMPVLDTHTREGVAWEFLPFCRATEALGVIETSVSARFPKAARADGLAFVVDRGSQFVAQRF